MKKRILVAEDEKDAREGLIDVLESEGCSVVAAEDGEECCSLFETDKFDLLLLDIMMPEKSGYDLCRQIRARGIDVPIILLTAKGEEIDKVVGLELGADDYITKPFGIRELLARIKAVLRRAEMKGSKAKTHDMPDKFKFGSATVNRRRYEIINGKRSHQLTARELALLEQFACHPEAVLSRDELLNAVWGIDYLGTTRTLDQHIAQLRKKVEVDPSKPEVILTVHGIGYRYST